MRTRDTFQSPFLHEELLGSIEALQEQQDQLSTGFSNEKREKNVAEASFSEGYKKCSEAFPLDVLKALHDCTDTDMHNDESCNEIVSSLRSFTERAPRFVEIVCGLEVSLSETLVEVLPMGNASLIDQQKVMYRDKLAANLEDLADAISHLLSALNLMLANAKDSREHGQQERVLLEQLIDEALNRGHVGPDMSTLMKMLTTISRGDHKLSEGDYAEEQDYEAKKSVEEYEGIVADITEEKDDEMVGTVEEIALEETAQDIDHTLESIEKEENVMKTSDQDKRDEENIMSLEELRKDEILKQLVGRNKNVIDDVEIISKASLFDKEKELLMKRQDKERDDKLKAMMRVIFDADDFESPHDKAVVSLANSRFSARLRYEGALGRVLLYEFRVQCASEENALLSVAASSNWSRETTIERLDAFLNEKENAIQGVLDQIHRSKKNTEEEEDFLRERWLRDTSGVVIEEEAIKIKSEMDEYFMDLKGKLKMITERAKDNVDAECQFLEIATISGELKKVINHEEEKEKFINSIASAIERRKVSVAMQNEAELKKLLFSEEQVQEILEYATNWGRNSFMRERQHNLHSRVLVGMQITLDSEMRLVQMENDLRSESQQMNLVGYLNSRNASQLEVSQALDNFHDAEKDRSELLLKSASLQFRKRVEEEQQHQSDALLDYESEYFRVVEQNSAYLALMDLKLKRARLSLHILINQAVLSKRDGIEEQLNRQNAPSFIKDLAMKQIEAEAKRESFELNAAFVSLRGGWLTLENFVSSMTEGRHPCIDFTKCLAEEAFSREFAELFTAFEFDIQRSIVKNSLSSFIWREANAKRLVNLAKIKNGSDQHSDPTEEDDMQAAEDFLSKMLREDFSQNEKLLISKLKDNMSVQTEYADELKTATSKLELTLLSLKSNLDANKREATVSNGEHGDIEVEFCTQLSTAHMQYETDMYTLFNEYMGRIVSMAKLDDQVRAMQQIRQQDGEARRNALEAEKLQRIEKLTASQLARREEAQSIVEQNEVQLYGLKSVLQAQAEKQRSQLQKKLQDRKMKRQMELEQGGLSKEGAEDFANEEFQANDEMLAKELEKKISLESTQRLKRGEDESRQLKNLKNEKSRVVDNILCSSPLDNELLNNSLNALQADTDADIERLNKNFENKLKDIEDSYDGEEKENQIQTERRCLEKSIAALKRRHNEATEILRDGTVKCRENHLKRLETRLKRERAAKISSLEEKGFSKEDATSKIDEESAHQIQIESDRIEKTQEYVGELVAEGYDDQMRAILLQHEMNLRGLHNILDYQKSSTKKGLLKRLQRKKKARKITLDDRSDEEKNSVIDEEFLHDEKKINQSIMKIVKKVNDGIQQSTNILKSAEKLVSKRLDDLNDKEEQELTNILIDFNAAVEKEAQTSTDQKTMDEIRAAGMSSQSALDHQTRQLRRRRDRDIEGIKTQLERTKKEELKRREDDLLKREEIVRAKLLEQHVPPSEVEDKVKTQLEMEKSAMVLDLNREFAQKLEKAVAERIEQCRMEERQLIAQNFSEAEKEAKAASMAKDSAIAELERIKVEQETEKKNLENSLKTERQNRESALRRRLAEKKAVNLRKIQESIHDEGEKVLAIDRVTEEATIEEQDELLKFQVAADEEDDRILREHEERSNEAFTKATKESRLREIEAAEAVAKEAALRGAREAEERVDKENKARELQRLKEFHAKEAEKEEKESEAKKSKGKGNLEARLAMKRAKREKELKEKEEFAMNELAKKQQEELEKEAVSQKARERWMEALREARQKASLLAGGLVGKALSDYLISETVGKKLVPDEQMFDCLKTIFEEKNCQEEAELVSQQYEERIQALKPAVEKIQNEMKVEREILLERLENEKADETEMKTSVNAFVDQYTAIQRAEEERIIRGFEAGHLKQQTDLRLRQMQDINQLVVLYSDPQNIEALMAAAGEAQLIEMSKFRTSLEVEKREREEKLLLERREIEIKMREEHEADLERRRIELQSEKAKAEEDLERRKREIERQKEEAARKQAETLVNVNNEEKVRILEAYQKEQAASNEAEGAAQLAKKKKIQLRLAKRKSKNQNHTRKDETHSNDKDSTVSDLANQSLQAPISDAVKKLNNTGTPQSLVNSLSLIEEKLGRIESMMGVYGNNAATKWTTLQRENEAANSMGKLSFHDSDDPIAGETLELTSEEDIHVQESCRLEFGRLLASLVGLKDLKIRIAKSLPPNSNELNTFRNSYHYSHQARCLYVHHSRISTSGDFGLILIHALSHIKVLPDGYQDWNDQSMLFKNEFYKNLRILSQDLFKKSMAGSQITPASKDAITSLTSLTRQYSGAGTKVSLSRSNSMRHNSLLNRKEEFPSSLDNSPNDVDLHESSNHGSNQPFPLDEDTEKKVQSQNIEERITQYLKIGGLPPDFARRYSTARTPQDSNLGPLSENGLI